MIRQRRQNVLRGLQLYENHGAGAMEVANYQAEKQFGALPN
jgi:hypothetical protein